MLALCAFASLPGPTAALRQDSTAALRVSLDARSLQPGELVVVTVTTDRPADAVTVRAFDRDAPAYELDDRHWQALVGIDLDTAPRDYVVEVRASVVMAGHVFAAILRIGLRPDIACGSGGHSGISCSRFCRCLRSSRLC